MGRFLGKAGASLSRARDERRRVDEQAREHGEWWAAAAPARNAGDRPDTTDRDTEPFNVEDDDA